MSRAFFTTASSAVLFLMSSLVTSVVAASSCSSSAKLASLNSGGAVSVMGADIKKTELGLEQC